MVYIGAGRLDQPLEVLELREIGAGLWEWVPIRRAWGQVEQTAKTNLFSKVGVGARDAALVVRRQPLTLHNALRWKGKHLFLTSIIQRDRNHLDVAAALVEPVPCRATRQGNRVGQAGRPVTGQVMQVDFPGILTEKYVRYQREETHDESEMVYVLVTPKAVQLRGGDLVQVQDGPAKGTYHVTVSHVLDLHKNEYELMQGEDI